ncbi:MAG: ATPase [Bacilli bacterium]|nr:ATPase [Bacilli bacterium]
MKEKKRKKILPRAEEIERSLYTTFQHEIYRKFTEALTIYELLKPNDKVCVCISGGKDSMMLALLFKHLHRYTKFPFEVSYLVMDPGYNEKNRRQIEENLEILEIPATIVSTDIFAISNESIVPACYLCAKMRRGALYRVAKRLGCNKIALGHHYDDVIETTLMNMLNAGSFQTMLPKVHSDHFEGMELIRPLYLVREEFVKAWAKANELTFIRCACRFTENSETDSEGSRRAMTKELIRRLKEEYSPYIEKNLFKSASNVNVDMVLGYKDHGEMHTFLDHYGEECANLDRKIREEGIEIAAEKKAEEEHNELVFDNRFLD